MENIRPILFYFIKLGNLWRPRTPNYQRSFALQLMKRNRALFPTRRQCHRRIQDFVRGGQCPLGPRGGGGKALLADPESAPDYLGEQFFVGRGGGGQGPPPLDPRLSAYGPVQSLPLFTTTSTAFGRPFPDILRERMWRHLPHSPVCHLTG